ncbi:hypothetical protein QYF36_005550 [Acer negundo]|nr:hypothetical protein QYF36_005550 [Acer negundo]
MLSPSDDSKQELLKKDVETQLEESDSHRIVGSKKPEGRGSKLLTRTHHMSTRRSIHKKVKWNLENEIARVIEKGVAHGIELKVRKQRIANGREGGEEAD